MNESKKQMIKHAAQAVVVCLVQERHRMPEIKPKAPPKKTNQDLIFQLLQP
jgi:hypothetical protein